MLAPHERFALYGAIAHGDVLAGIALLRPLARRLTCPDVLDLEDIANVHGRLRSLHLMLELVYV